MFERIISVLVMMLLLGGCFACLGVTLLIEDVFPRILFSTVAFFMLCGTAAATDAIYKRHKK